MARTSAILVIDFVTAIFSHGSRRTVRYQGVVAQPERSDRILPRSHYTELAYHAMDSTRAL